MEHVVEVKNLERIYEVTKRWFRGKGKSIKAMDGLSFFVERGEIFGLLGQNGAGKTTTIKMLISDIAQWVVGNSYLLCTNICIFNLGISFTGERSFGRIRSIVCCPTWKIRIVLQKAFFPCLECIGTTLIGFLAGSLVFGVNLGQINWVLYLLILLVAMIAATGLGMFLSTLGLMTDQMDFVLNTMNYILLIFTGANFSVEQLPSWSRIISSLLPLSRSIKASQMLFTKYNLDTMIELLGGELILAVVYGLGACIMIKIAEKVARDRGTLELF